MARGICAIGRVRVFARAAALFFLFSGFLPHSLLAQKASSGVSMAPTRPISDPERAAVQFALDYLSRGADSWIPSLATSSRFAGLKPDQIKAEIESRAGPSDGATWQLLTGARDDREGRVAFAVEFPSGMDTHLALELSRHGPSWKIQDVRSFAEPLSDDVREARSEPAPGPQAPAPQERPRQALALLGVGVALELAGLLVAWRRFRAAVGLIFLGVVAIASAVVVVRQADSADQRPAVGTLAPARARIARLGILRDLLRALSTCESGRVQSVLDALPTSGTVGEVRRVWSAAWALHERNLAVASETLASFPIDSRIPEVEILRGRLGFLKNRPRDVYLAYETAAGLGANQDALLLEAARFFRLMSDDDSAAACVAKAVHNGSRLAEASYSEAAQEIREQHGPEAERWFLQAWHLHPIEREVLLQEPFFWDLLRRPSLYAELELDSPDERAVSPAETSSRPVVLSAGSQARLCGSYLRIRSGTSRLEIPGGASLAPVDTASENAGAWSRQEEQEAISSIRRLWASGGTVAGSLDPILRQQVELAARGFSRQRQWEDIVQLTRGVSDSIDQFSADLILLRAEALRRTDQPVLSRELLHQAAATEAFVKRTGPGTLFELALALGSFADYDLGIDIAEKAGAKLRNPEKNWLVERMRLEQKLSASFANQETEHFLIRYPRAQPGSGTRKLGAVLDGERERLTRWIPLHSYGRTEVQLLWFQDFEQTYSGDVGIVGVFDGRIRLPFAGGDNLDFSQPEIVSIVTHELAHAMISELTLDSAPHWFQEGLAQHLEMRPEHFNPVPQYEAHSRYLSLPVVEGVLEGLPAPDLAEVAYEESMWMVHYLEDSGGIKTIQALLQAFRAGSNTEDALKKVSYASISDFESRFRQWCRRPTSYAWKRPVLRYIGHRGRSADLPASLQESSRRVVPAAEEAPPRITPNH